MNSTVSISNFIAESKQSGMHRAEMKKKKKKNIILFEVEISRNVKTGK